MRIAIMQKTLSGIESVSGQWAHSRIRVVCRMVYPRGICSCGLTWFLLIWMESAFVQECLECRFRVTCSRRLALTTKHSERRRWGFGFFEQWGLVPLITNDLVTLQCLRLCVFLTSVRSPPPEGRDRYSVLLSCRFDANFLRLYVQRDLSISRMSGRALSSRVLCSIRIRPCRHIS